MQWFGRRFLAGIIVELKFFGNVFRLKMTFICISKSEINISRRFVNKEDTLYEIRILALL